MIRWAKPTIPTELSSLTDGEEKQKYRNPTCRWLHEIFFKTRPVCIDRRLAFEEFNLKELVWIFQRGWKPIMNLKGLVCQEYFRDFMENIDRKKSVEGTILFSYVKGEEISITPDVISSVLKVPREIGEIKVRKGVISWEFRSEDTFDYDNCEWQEWEKIYKSVCVEGTVWPATTNNMVRSTIKEEYYYQLEATYAYIFPAKRNSDVNIKTARLVHAITLGLWIDLPLYIFKYLFNYGIGVAGTAGIPYGKLLTKVIGKKVGGDLPDCITERRKINKLAVKKSMSRIKSDKQHQKAQYKMLIQQLSREPETVDKDDDQELIDSVLEPEVKRCIAENYNTFVSTLSDKFVTFSRKRNHRNECVKSLSSAVDQMSR